MASDRAALHENVAFLILVLSTKKQYSSFVKKCLHFSENLFPNLNIENLQNFLWLSHKTWRSLERRAILKIPSTVFRRTYAASVGFKMEPRRKNVFLCNDKKQLKFWSKHYWNAERSNIHFCLFDNIFQTSVLFNPLVLGVH